MILKLTTLAWNFTLLDPIEQGEMLVEIADLFQCPEGMEMFYYLADRMALLFPQRGTRYLQGRNGAQGICESRGIPLVHLDAHLSFGRFRGAAAPTLHRVTP